MWIYLFTSFKCTDWACVRIMLTNVSESYGFSSGHVWMWELDYKESWVLKNWCFWTMVLGKTLQSPLECKEIQPVHQEISPGCSLEGLILKLKLQYFGQLMRRVDSLEKTLMLGGIEGRRRRGWQRMRWLDGITDSMGLGLGRLRKLVMDREAWRAGIHWSQRVSHDWVTELNWTELMMIYLEILYSAQIYHWLPLSSDGQLTLPLRPGISSLCTNEID